MDIEIRDLVFQRGEFRLDVPELTFVGGRVTALVGPNGSGKSTLLRLMAGLERQQAGTITLDGAQRAPRDRQRSLAYAFQEAVFLGGSLRQNLDLALRLRGVAGAERDTRADDAANACGIGALLDRDAARLSGGERQRANLARALCLAAPVTLLDEPMAGLDGPARTALLHDLPGLLSAYAATTVLVTHTRDEALRLGDDMVVMIDGSVRAAGPKREVFLAPPDPATAAFLGYAVVTTDRDTLAIRPGTLAAGAGDCTFDLVVETVVDMATHHEVAGSIGGTAVALPWHGDLPAPGDRVVVSAANDAVVRYGRDDLL